MTAKEATFLLAALGVVHVGRGAVARLEALCDERGFQIGMDNQTGDWVVLGQDQSVLARCA